MKVTNKFEDNNLDIIRRKLRKNKIVHTKFDPSLDNSEGRRYYTGIYVPNKELTDENGDEEIKNLYEYIVSNGLHLKIDETDAITHLRTGYDPEK